jgi:hypothetical protein
MVSHVRLWPHHSAGNMPRDMWAVRLLGTSQPEELAVLCVCRHHDFFTRPVYVDRDDSDQQHAVRTRG